VTHVPFFSARDIDAVDVLGVEVGDELVANRVVKVVKSLWAGVLQGRHELSIAVWVRLIADDDIGCNYSIKFLLLVIIFPKVAL